MNMVYVNISKDCSMCRRIDNCSMANIGVAWKNYSCCKPCAVHSSAEFHLDIETNFGIENEMAKWENILPVYTLKGNLYVSVTNDYNCTVT